MSYDVRNWYWLVAGDDTQAWSSASAAYVAATDETYEAWLAAGNSPTKIDSEASLQAVLTEQFPAGWPGLAIKAQLAALDPLLPRALEDYWEVSQFDTTKLNARQQAILAQKQALRQQLG